MARDYPRNYPLVLSVAKILTVIVTLFLPVTALAGQLDLGVKNINFSDSAPAVDSATGVITIDKPDFILRTLPPSTDPHIEEPTQPQIGKIKSTGAAMADERIITTDHPLDVHIELNVARIDPGSSLTEFLPNTFLARVELSGAVFKTQINGEDIIRSGNLDGGRFGADSLALTGGEGSNNVELAIYNFAEHQQSDFGLLLPLRISGGDNDPQTPCGHVSVEVQIFSTISGSPPLAPAKELVIFTCESSFDFEAEPDTVKIDFQQGFKGFATQDHEPIRNPIIGKYSLELWPNLFDVKVTHDTEARRIGIDDIEDHQFTLQFEDLTGIEEVNVIFGQTDTKVSGTIDRETNSALFSIEGTLLEQAQEDNFPTSSPFYDIHDDPTPLDISVNAYVELVSFPEWSKKFVTLEQTDAKGQVNLVKVPTGAGSIAQQTISMTHNRLVLRNPCKDEAGNIISDTPTHSATTATRICSINFPDAVLGQLIFTGEHFGPFDMVGQNNRDSIFRITNIPTTDSHGNPRMLLKGRLIVKNATGSASQPGEFYDGNYEFELPFDQTLRAFGANGTYFLTSYAIKQILINSGRDRNFGTADISYIFYLQTEGRSGNHGDENLVIDMDRLLWNDGTLTNFGDNSNDVSSEHSVSGDSGRFGNGAPLKPDYTQP